MIKVLRRKFIITNMLLVIFVIISAYTILYITSAHELEEQSVSAMHDASNKPKDKPNGPERDEPFKPKDNNKDKPPKNQYFTIYTIDFDESNGTYTIEGFNNNKQINIGGEENVDEIIDIVHESEENEGVLKKYNMRYLRVDAPDGHRIVLLDKEYEDDRLNQLLVTYLLSGLILTVALLGVSFIISGFLVKPVEKSINQQKQLISDISHELKTPLTVILSNTDVVLSHETSTVKDEKKWLEYIKDETNRMSDMLQTMLYLARSDEADRTLILNEVNLSNLAYEVVLPFESICYENNKSFNFSICDNALIKGDEQTLKQLILILLDNAVKYSNENGSISFKLDVVLDKAVLSVFNTGEAIPKESLPLIFDRFYRVDKARSRDKGGCGLGLSIAKHIIDINHASISVSSEPSYGTTFTCSFNISKRKSRDKDHPNVT